MRIDEARHDHLIGGIDHFGLDTVKDLPGLEELKAAGLLDARLPPGFAVPQPEDALPEEEEEDDDQDDLFEGDMATPFDDGGDEADGV